MAEDSAGVFLRFLRELAIISDPATAFEDQKEKQFPTT